MKSKFRDQFNHSEWCLNDETGTRFLSHINITRTWGVKPAELTASQILQTDSTDYLMNGNLILKNGRIDKYLFDGGYAKATPSGSSSDSFAFYYYNQDHLGNIREVVDASGTVQQVTNYYPFGAPYFDASSTKNADMQPYKYNGKELDRMHGLDAYDYGARQYDPILARWDRIDPLCEKYYNVSPYAYCANNPVKYIDPDGREKKKYLTENEIQNSDYNLYPENTPGVLNIWAHGVRQNPTDEFAWAINVREDYIDNAQSFKNSVLDDSKEWNKNDGKNITIVLHSCFSSDLAKKFSEDKLFKGKNITFVAPNATLVTNKNGSHIKSKTFVKGKSKEVVKREEGKWMAYKDGELVNTYSAKSHSATIQSGIIGERETKTNKEKEEE